MYHRVKYYPPNDFAFGLGLDRMEQIYSSDITEITKDINDIIELYNISIYFDNGVQNKAWSTSDCENYKEFASKIKPLVFAFFNSITDDNIISIIESLYTLYFDDFWVMFDKTKLWNKISKQRFGDILNNDKCNIRSILHYKNIVEKYADEIKKYLLSDLNAANILIDQNCNNGKHRIFLPSNINLSDKECIFTNYINSDSPNPNILNDIYLTEIPISPKVKLNAKRTADNLEKQYFDQHKGAGMKVETIVRFSKQQEEVIYKGNNSRIEIMYSTNWILDNLDYPTILNNFIFLFNFVDQYSRMCHVHKNDESTIFENILFGNNPKYYKTDFSFNIKQHIALMQISSYYALLKEKNVYLENVVEWFFSTYIVEEFSLPAFRVKLPSVNTEYSEKCTLIVAAIDSIIKQFKLLVQDGSIDFELLQLISAPIKFNDIPSFFGQKYAYGVGDDYSGVVHLLFSNQSLLTVVERIDKEYSSFFEIVRNETIFTTDFNDYSLANIKWLESQGIIKINSDQSISFADIKLIFVLKDLFKNDFINVTRFPYVETLDTLYEKNYIRYGSTLLSEQESSLFNYYFNRAEFSNGLDLRNKYAHGVQQTIEDEEQHKIDYFILFRFLVLLVIKINDELCCKDISQDSEEIV